MNIEEAIGDLKYYIGEDPYFNGTYKPVTDFEKYCYSHCKAIDTVLNELEKKDKVIDKMAEKLVEAHEWFYSEFDNYTKEDWKEYFYKKVE